MPYLEIILSTRCQPTVTASMSWTAAASGYRVKMSTKVKMYLFLFLESGRGPFTSKAILCNRQTMGAVGLEDAVLSHCFVPPWPVESFLYVIEHSEASFVRASWQVMAHVEDSLDHFLGHTQPWALLVLEEQKSIIVHKVRRALEFWFLFQGEQHLAAVFISLLGQFDCCSVPRFHHFIAVQRVQDGGYDFGVDHDGVHLDSRQGVCNNVFATWYHLHGVVVLG
ncbi:uncharacterized protein LOC132193559 [Neocloeon triangulifer]|uniref:uncharacterized protein LOC132193559 n=1 Tax=Neocloeon triangulifer TaxID=2078957 RepID=UPI00286F5284|nr:uncharacterized protein LOC132193559 [Neocloeon triangulifer]